MPGAGVVGIPKYWDKAWGFVQRDADFVGWEMIAWGDPMAYWAKSLLSNAKSRGLNVVGLHGRTGGIHDSYSFKDRVVLGSLNRILVPTHKLLTLANDTDYLLLHAPELRDHKIMASVIAHKDTIKTLYVENHLRPGSLGTAMGVAKDLRSHDVNAGVMFDLWHDLESRLRYDSLQTAFSNSVRALANASTQEDYAGCRIPLGMHLPIGTNRFDSVPFGQISKPMWKQLGDVVNSIPGLYVVLENQQGGLGGVLPYQMG